MQKQLVIGLGTGRNGTVALVNFFDHQPHCYTLHEGSTHDRRTILRWTGDDSRAIDWLKEIERMSGDATHFGDTGFYYLPYVESILSAFPNARFVCLERDRKEVVDSYLRKTSDNRNFWYDHGGVGYRADSVWDAAFPKFDEPDKKTALELYWDMYHQEATALESRIPDNFRIFRVEELATSDGQSRILDFVDYHGERHLQDDPADILNGRTAGLVDRLKNLFRFSR